MKSSDPLPRCFEVVVVPFLYADKLAEKRRPALVVSADAFDRKHGVLWVVMITSAANPRCAPDRAGPATEEHESFRDTALHVLRIASAILPDAGWRWPCGGLECR